MIDCRNIDYEAVASQVEDFKMQVEEISPKLCVYISQGNVEIYNNALKTYISALEEIIFEAEMKSKNQW